MFLLFFGLVVVMIFLDIRLFGEMVIEVWICRYLVVRGISISNIVMVSMLCCWVFVICDFWDDGGV